MHGRLHSASHWLTSSKTFLAPPPPPLDCQLIKKEIVQTIRRDCGRWSSMYFIFTLTRQQFCGHERPPGPFCEYQTLDTTGIGLIYRAPAKQGWLRHRSGLSRWMQGASRLECTILKCSLLWIWCRLSGRQTVWWSECVSTCAWTQVEVSDG